MKSVAVHTIDHYLGLSETFIYTCLTHIRNYDVLVITNRLRNLDQFPFSPIYATEQLRKYGYWWLRNHLDFHFNRTDHFFEHRSYFLKKIKEINPALIHAHFGPTAMEMLYISTKLQIPLATTFYGYDITRLPRENKWRTAYQRLFDHGTLFLVEGPVMKRHLLDLGCPEAKIRLQPIAIDLAKYEFRVRRFSADSKRIKLIFCGRFVEKKGLMYALRAFVIARQKYPNIHFQIIGDGEFMPVIRNFIEENKLSNFVELTGNLSHDAVINFMQQADILIQPSVTASDGDTEGGAPTTILEAQAMGLIVVATDHADIPNILSSPLRALLVPERDEQALASLLTKLIESPDIITSLSQSGRNFVEQRHDINLLAPRLERYYHEASTS